MDRDQIDLVRNSFALTQPITCRAAALFFANLFERDAGLRSTSLSAPPPEMSCPSPAVYTKSVGEEQVRASRAACGRFTSLVQPRVKLSCSLVGFHLTNRLQQFSRAIALRFVGGQFRFLALLNFKWVAGHEG